MKKFILLFVFVQTAVVFAQNIEIGLRFDYNGLKRSQYFVEDRDFQETNISFLRFPTNWHAVIGVYPWDFLSVEARIGRELAFDNFQGMEYSLFSKYHYKDYLYFVGGAVIHSNDVVDDGISHGNYVKSFIMPGVGIGAKVFKHLSLEVLYLNGGDELLNYRNVTIDGNYVPVPGYRLQHIIKFSLGYTFTFGD